MVCLAPYDRVALQARGRLSGSALPRAIVAEPTCTAYRPRHPQSTALFRLLEALYEQAKLVWEERFETRYGYWRGLVDEVVARYLDCGVLERGFARVACSNCQAEFLVALSCKGRGLCPSCAAKRAAIFAAFLSEHVLEPVEHAQWVFTIPKMLRPYFLHHRELLGPLCRAAYETVRELMTHAIGAQPGFRPGFIAVVQTWNSDLRWNPHIHAIVSRGGWDRERRWIPVAHIDPRTAERLFRLKVLRLLRQADLLDDARAALLLSWQHRTGFSVHNSTTVHADDHAGLERLARYLLRAPVSLERIHWDEDEGVVRYAAKSGHDDATTTDELFDSLEFIARLLVHIPAPRLHAIRYFGAYSAVTRARHRRQNTLDSASEPQVPSFAPDEPSTATSARRQWGELIRRIYEVDPLTCSCGGSMRIIAFIFERKVIHKILDHLQAKGRDTRAPP